MDEDEDHYDLDDREVCEGCGRYAACEHLEGFGRDRVLCHECIENIFQ